MNRIARALLALSTISGAATFAHRYEVAITAKPIGIQNKSTDILGMLFQYEKGTPSITPLNVALGTHEETNWHKHNAPLWVYVTDGSFIIDYGSKGKKQSMNGCAT